MRVPSHMHQRARYHASQAPIMRAVEVGPIRDLVYAAVREAYIEGYKSASRPVNTYTRVRTTNRRRIAP